MLLELKASSRSDDAGWAAEAVRTLMQDGVARLDGALSPELCDLCLAQIEASLLPAATADASEKPCSESGPSSSGAFAGEGYVKLMHAENND